MPVEDFRLLSAAFKDRGGENGADEVKFEDKDCQFKMFLGEMRVRFDEELTNEAKRQLLPLNGFSVHTFKKSIEDRESAADDTVTIRSSEDEESTEDDTVTICSRKQIYAQITNVII